MASGAPVARVAPARSPGVSAVAPVASSLRFDAPSLLGGPSISLNASDSALVVPDEHGIIAPEEKKIIAPKRKEIIVPERKKIITDPEPMIIEAERELTEEEAHPDKMPSKAELDRLAKSLTGEDDDSAPNAAAGAETKGRAMSAAFDGAAPISAEDAAVVRGYFQDGRPHAPKLDRVHAAALRMFRGLLPSFYRRVPMTARYDEGPNPSTGHLWSVETGHVIELAPAIADTQGNVSSEFAIPGLVRVQQKVEQLLQFVHEYAHVIFDAEVKKAENHAPLSAFSAMTEGFAVTLEQEAIERAVADPATLGLSPRDVADFLAIQRGRRDWLAAMDTHYSEGIAPWRKAFERDGVAGVAKLLASLSSHRMVTTMRSDPAYQLAVEEPELIVAYLGKDRGAEHRAGLEAFKKAAEGEDLDEEARKAAAAAIEKAGPDGRRRVFERALLESKKVSDPRQSDERARWWESSEAPSFDVRAPFALARLSRKAAKELSIFLTETMRSGRGDDLFGSRGHNEKLNAIVSQAESLPFAEADRETWTEALTKWLFDGVGGRV
jgi:hypothetical protein